MGVRGTASRRTPPSGPPCSRRLMRFSRRSMRAPVRSCARSLATCCLQRRAAGVGFDWPDVAGVLEKVDEELAELRDASTPEERESEFGDLLFTLVNVARRMGMNPEDALRAATGRFEARFRSMEQ